MPFSFGVMAALATLLLCATAYIDPTQTYTWYGEMYSEYLYGPNQGATSDFGAFLFRYYPTTKTLSYNVYTSFKHTAFGMYGPTLCYAPSTNPLNFPINVVSSTKKILTLFKLISHFFFFCLKKD